MVKKKFTYDVLNTQFLVGGAEIDRYALNTALKDMYKSVDGLYLSTTRKPTSLAWDALVTVTDELLHLKYGRGYRCNNHQLKRWLNEYGLGYDTIKSTVSFIEDSLSERSVSHGKEKKTYI